LSFVGLHVEGEKSYTVTGVERVFHRYRCEEEGIVLFRVLEVLFFELNTRQGNGMYALSQVQSDF
jgi:hypothetical protein